MPTSPFTLARLGMGLVSEADGPAEKLGVIRFMGDYVRARAGGGAREAEVKLHGIRWHALVNAGELTGDYLAIFRDEIYAAVPGFAAAPGDVVIDGGANIGMYAVWQAMRGARVFSFEVDTALLERLRHNAEANRVSGEIKIYPVGLADVASTARLEHPDDKTIATMAVADDAGDMELVALDDVVADEGIDRVAVLKLNIEGSEVLALRGAAKTLERTARVVVQYQTARHLGACTRLLVDAGFSPVRIDRSLAFFVADDLLTDADRDVTPAPAEWD